MSGAGGADSSDAAERFFLLQWAGSRPGVLSLLKALKEHGYDETGAEYLRRIVDGRGIAGERRAASDLVDTAIDSAFKDVPGGKMFGEILKKKLSP